MLERGRLPHAGGAVGPPDRSGLRIIHRDAPGTEVRDRRRHVGDEDSEGPDAAACAQRCVDLRPIRPEARTGDRLVVDRDQLDVPGIKTPCGIVRAELRMLSSGLHGKPKDLIIPHGHVQVGHPVDQMVELHYPILHSQPANG